MKKVKEFYIIVSKDKKYFTGASYQPHELNYTNLTKMRGFKTREAAELGIKEGVELLTDIVEDYKHRQREQALYLNFYGLEGWQDQIDAMKPKIAAIEGGTVKKVSISWEVED